MRAVLIGLVMAIVGCGGQRAPAPGSGPGVGDAPRLGEVHEGGAEDAAPPEGKLPVTVRPVRYALEMSIVPEEDEFSGVLSVEVEIAEATSVIWMHRRDLEIGRAQVMRGDESFDAQIIEGNKHVFGIRTGAPVPAGPARVRVEFRGRFDDDRTQGLYRQAEPDGAVYAYTKFEPIDARQAFPCFDEPHNKVPWQLTFRVKKDHVALANAPVEREIDNGDGTKTVVVAESRPMPSYLVAFVIGPFDLVEAGTVGRPKVPLRFIVPRGRGGETRYAAEVTPRVVTLLEDYFDMGYPYEKLDVAVVPRYWGTMEHPGIVVMGQPLTLIPPDAETDERKRWYANILIHELAHYWFGDYVTMVWWDDIWLNESFGTWLDAKITHALEPSWGFDLERRVGMRSAAMATDALPSAKAIRQPAGDNHGIESSFDNAITYYKGASILFMFEQWVGEERFRDAMRRYMERFAWKNATTEDLYAVLADVLGEELPPALDGFVSSGGHPVVAMELRCERGQAPALEVSQSRYVPLGIEATNAGQRWAFPICVRHPKGKGTHRQCALLTEPSATIALETDRCPAWVNGNDGGYGYYRVAYAPALLEALGRRGVAHQSAAERLVQLDDLEALVQAGRVPLRAALDYGLRMAKESDPRLVRASIGALSWGSLIPDDLRPKHHALLRKTYGPWMRRLGWTRRPKDDAATHELRLAVIGTLGYSRDPAVTREARARAERYLADRKAVADDLVGLVLGIAALGGDATLFDAYLAAAAEARDHRDKQRFLSALGEFRDPALIERALAVVTDPSWDLRESLSIAFRLLSDRDTRPRAWAFLKEHFDSLAPRITQTTLIAMFSLASRFCTADDIADAEAFLRARADAVEGAPPFVARGLEQARRCAAVRARHEADMIDFLKRP